MVLYPDAENWKLKSAKGKDLRATRGQFDQDRGLGPTDGKKLGSGDGYTAEDEQSSGRRGVDLWPVDRRNTWDPGHPGSGGAPLAVSWLELVEGGSAGVLGRVTRSPGTEV